MSKLEDYWEPIHTAPKDRAILCWNDHFGAYNSRFDGEDWPCGFSNDTGHVGTWYPVPTHWMPLPTPKGE